MENGHRTGVPFARCDLSKPVALSPSALQFPTAWAPGSTPMAAQATCPQQDNRPGPPPCTLTVPGLCGLAMQARPTWYSWNSCHGQTDVTTQSPGMTPGCLHVATVSFALTYWWLRPGPVFSGATSRFCPLTLSNAISYIPDGWAGHPAWEPKPGSPRAYGQVSGWQLAPPETDHCLDSLPPPKGSTSLPENPAD